MAPAGPTCPPPVTQQVTCRAYLPPPSLRSPVPHLYAKEQRGSGRGWGREGRQLGFLNLLLLFLTLTVLRSGGGGG